MLKMLKMLKMLNELDVTFGTVLHVMVSKFLSDYKIITYTFEFRLPTIVLKQDVFLLTQQVPFDDMLNVIFLKLLV